ncbi:hypothetical protein [Marinactinospora rubrisoli]|uniref:Uncharacterized protein n=1 Tax=Marinactinospora rubrisoli TaxID=2715399 RepID=A0ABW2KMJ6_9ACTN
MTSAEFTAGSVNGVLLAADPDQYDWSIPGQTILSWIIGVGVVIAIIGVLIVAGKMIQANFTGDPWIAARGMGELPWIALGIVLLLVAGPAIGILLSRDQGRGDDWGGAIVNIPWIRPAEPDNDDDDPPLNV